jgi:FAD:protein FMN transferase
MIQDPIDPRTDALSVQLKDRAVSVAGSSEKSFEADGVTYSHIMDPRTGRPAQGVLSVAVLARTGTAGDALDNAFFVLGPDGSRDYLSRLPETEVFFFVPDSGRRWTLVTFGIEHPVPRGSSPSHSSQPSRVQKMQHGDVG